jgi:hypothetical protein
MEGRRSMNATPTRSSNTGPTTRSIAGPQTKIGQTGSLCRRTPILNAKQSIEDENLTTLIACKGIPLTDRHTVQKTRL